MSPAALYEGTVVHERRITPARSFNFRVSMPLIELDHEEDYGELAPLWRLERRAPMSFRREDFMGDCVTSLSSTIRGVVEQRAGFRPTGPIRLLAQHRTWGWVFNPIALYYCFAPDGVTLQAVVADVTNTPWGESHAYVIDTREGVNNLPEQAKALHVSPFLPMGLSYRFHLSPPGPICDFSVTVLRDFEVVFHSGFSLRRRAMTRSGLARTLLRHAFLTQRVSLGIYLHAARLWLRRATFYPHPPRTS